MLPSPSVTVTAAAPRHGGDERAAEHLRQRGDLGERRLHRAERRLVQHEIERRLAVARGAGRAARSRPRARRAGSRRARARRAGRRRRGGRRTASASAFGSSRSSSRQHASFWRKPVPAVPTTLTRSATTADAVSIPPAPGPSSVISRIASPWSITALKAPSTAASGCERSTNAGCTRTSTASSTSVAMPTSRTTMPRSAAAATCAGSISVMPRVSTSSSATREPKATVARIAIFAAASAPLTSSVGSASA